MKTIESFFLLIQFFIPGALSVGDFSPVENPYARIVAAFQNARCAEVKTVSLELVGDTLIVDAFGAYYSPAFQYPYSLLHEAMDTKRSFAPASPVSADSLVMLDRGFTDAQELRISVSKPGRYYLLINDVNRGMLEVDVSQRLESVDTSQRLMSGFASAELRIGCVVHE
jgi:hypothetical protein